MFSVVIMNDYTSVIGNIKNVGNSNFKFKKIYYPVEVKINLNHDDDGKVNREFTLESSYTSTFKSKLTKEIMVNSLNIHTIVQIYEDDTLYENYCKLLENYGVSDIRDTIARKNEQTN